MISTHRIFTLAALLWLLTGLAWAGPRVAIITPLSEADVWLGETPVEGPMLAEEGQKLLVGEQGEVRIQLLGSSKERVLKGSNLLVISKADLEKAAKPIDRGSVAVADEIGSLIRPAAASARKSNVTHHVVGFALELPPVKVDGLWRANVVTSPEALPARGVQVTVRDLASPSPHLALTVDQPTDHLAFPEDSLKLGGHYEIHVHGPKSGYYRQFQLLSREDRDDLARTAHIMRAEAIESGEIAMLLRLANLYAGFDETEKLADLLVEVVNRPDFKDLDTLSQDKLKGHLNVALRSLDRKNYEGP